VLLLNPFRSFVLHGAVAGDIIRPNNPRFVPVPINVWTIETSDKRAPGNISRTNAICNSMETMYGNKTPQSTPLKNTHGFRPRLGRCDDPNHRWWTGSNRPRFTSHAYATALTKARPPFCAPTDRVFHPICKGVPDSKPCVPTFFDPLSSSTGGGNGSVFGARPHSGNKGDHRVQTRSNCHRTTRVRDAPQRYTGTGSISSFVVLFV
jgi:hypothetical protein